jgi:uncharacterized membrane protein YbhN (UPF0104 family)
MIKDRAWSMIVVAVILVAIALYIGSQRHLLISIKNINLSALSYLVVIRVIFLILNGILLRELTLKYRIPLMPKEWFGLSVVTTMGNFITPFSGGLIARATYLKHRHALSYAKFASLLAANYLVYFWIVGVVGVITLMVFMDKPGYYWQVALFFVLVTLVISTLVMLPSTKLSWNNRLGAIINESLEGWLLIKSDKVLLGKLILYTLVNIFLHGFSFWIAFYALKGEPISFGPVFLISLLSVFSTLGNVTPGNLGIQEAVVSICSGILGIGAGIGLLASLLIRAATIIPTFTLGPIFSFVLTRELTSNKK